jgi:isoquinoline 1-oxidoreductase alpha subunit
MIKLTVNGVAHSLDVPEEMPLLWVLRDELDLKGPKYGCGVAQCGACTVHVDGNPVRACITPVGSVGGAVVTLEAMVKTPVGARLRQAWLDLDVMQCGYCQGGQIMAAAALLQATPKPADADIDAAMDGNLCRCATYTRIRAAIKRAADLPVTDMREA